MPALTARTDKDGNMSSTETGKKAVKNIRLEFRPDGTVYNLDTKRKVVPLKHLHKEFLFQHGWDHALVAHPEYGYHPAWTTSFYDEDSKVGRRGHKALKSRYEHKHQMQKLNAEILSDPHRVERSIHKANLGKAFDEMKTTVQKKRMVSVHKELIKNNFMNTVEVKLYAQLASGKEGSRKADSALEVEGRKYGLKQNEPMKFNITRALAEQLQTGHPIEVGSAAYETFLNAIRHSSTDGDKGEFLNAVSSRIDYAVIENLGAVPKPPTMNVGRRKAYLTNVNDLIAHPNLQVKMAVKDGKLSFVKTLEEHPELAKLTTENDCGIRVLMTTFKEGWDKYYKKEKSKLTHEMLRKCILGEHTTDLGMTPEQMLDWCKEKHFGLTMLDIQGNAIIDYLPAGRNKHIAPCHAYVLCHNDHFWALRDNISSLCKLTHRSTLDAPSPYYPNITFDHREFKQIGSKEELFAFFEATHLEKDKHYNIHYNGGLEDLHATLMLEYGYEPQVSVSGQAITRLKLNNLQNYYEINETPMSGLMTIHPEEYELYVEMLSKTAGALLRNDYKSSYSPSLQAAFSKYPKAQLVRKFSDDAPERSFGVDVIRAYTKNLMEMEKIPVFNSFDDFVEYRGEPIEPYNIYLIKNTLNTLESWFVCDKRISLITGEVLLKCGMDFKVLAYVRPSTLQTNVMTDVIRELYDSPLSTELKKFIINTTIGLTGKRYNQTEEGKFTTSKDEAWELCNEGYSPIICNHGYLGIRKSERVALENGFYSIQFWIFDKMRMRMLETYRTLKKHKVDVYGIKTDCLFVSDLPITLKLCPTKAFSDMGKLHKEDCKYIPMQMWEISENNVDIKVRSPQIDVEEVEKLQDGVLVSALLAGAGKTTFLERNLPKGETLFITPNNEQVDDIQTVRGHDCITVCRFLGMVMQKTGMTDTGNAFAMDSKYKWVVFNEVFKNPVFYLQRIQKRIKALRARGVHVVADGDPFQNVDFECNNVRKREYLVQAINSMFGKSIVLKTSHRYLNPGDVAKLMALKTDLFETDAGIKDLAAKYGFPILRKMEECYKFKKAIAFTNLMCSIVAPRMDGARGEYVGMCVVARKFNKKLITNHKYTVLSISDSAYYIQTKEKKEWVSKSYFRYPYCLTADSTQGSTIDEPYIIFESADPLISREWLWTSLTRGRRISDTFLYFGDLPTIDCKRLLGNKIERYRESDQKQGWKTDITVSWILETAKRQNYCCAECRNMFQMTWDEGDQKQVSVDRIDNSHGHTMKNCRLTCLHCNVSKH